MPTPPDKPRRWFQFTLGKFVLWSTITALLIGVFGPTVWKMYGISWRDLDPYHYTTEAEVWAVSPVELVVASLIAAAVLWLLVKWFATKRRR